MADPIALRLVDTAYVIGLAPGARPEIGDIVTVGLHGAVVLAIDATVVALEITDDGEAAILVDDVGCRWALPITAAERSA